MIYLDNASTTQVDPEVLKAMLPFWQDQSLFGNPSSLSHRLGWIAKEELESSREKIASYISCNESEVIFTSGSTESNNLALKGLAKGLSSKGNHIITSNIDHKSILDAAKYLEKNEAISVSYLKTNASGLIDPSDVKKAINDKTILISIIYGNNEIGSLNHIQEISEIAKTANVLLHVDATQSIAHPEAFDELKKSNVDLISFNAHKIHGPKGIGALIAKKSVQNYITPLIHGGSQERGLRSGTSSVPLIVGLAKALELANHNSSDILKMKKTLWEGLKNIPSIKLNGCLDRSLPNILNVSFMNLESEAIMQELDQIALSSGSACNTSDLEPSYVLQALYPNQITRARSAIRFSVSRFNTMNEIEQVIKSFHKLFRTQ